MPEYDTLSSDQQASILIRNTEKYIEAFKGSDVSFSDKIISNSKALKTALESFSIQ